MPVTVLISDDCGEFRRRLRRAIEGVVAVVGEASSDEETIRMARELRPDLVLIDVDLPLEGGIEVVRRLKAERPEAKVILLSEQGADARVPALGSCGADALLTKSHVKTEALKHLRSVAGPLLWRWDGRERRGCGRPSALTWDGRERRLRPGSAAAWPHDTKSGVASPVGERPEAKP
jgi:CheY-like chemotaxis protein